MNVSRKKAFTLVELLVVVAIITILAMMLLPTLKHAMRQARLVACKSNQKQFGVISFLYADDYDSWLPNHGNGAIWAPNIMANQIGDYVSSPGVLFCPDPWYYEDSSCTPDNWNPSKGWCGYIYVARCDNSKTYKGRVGRRGWKTVGGGWDSDNVFSFRKTNNPNFLKPTRTPIISDFLRYGWDGGAKERELYSYLDGQHIAGKPGKKSNEWDDKVIGRNQCMADGHVRFLEGWDEMTYGNWCSY